MSIQKTNFKFRGSSMALPYNKKGGSKTSNSNSKKENQLHDSMEVVQKGV